MREILRVTLASPPGPGEHLVEKIRRIAASVGYFEEFEAPPRQFARRPPDFK